MEQKYKDFWDKHNLGTRFALVTFVALYVTVAILAMMVDIKAAKDVYAGILDTVSYTAILAFVTVTLGVNGAKVVLDGIAKIKGK